jgi:CSLREA domain-containing protein
MAALKAQGVLFHAHACRPLSLTCKAFRLLLLLGALLAGFAPAHAATITVDTTTDEEGNPGPGTGCSLREAIQSVNGAADDGGCTNTGAGYGTNDTINVPAGTYTTTIAGAGEDLNATGDYDINVSVAIVGAGANSTIIDGSAIDRVFFISGAYTVSISGVTIMGGYANGGSGVHNNGGTTTITNSTISGNSSVGASGGGIYNGGTLTVNNSTISGNSATNMGAGISNYGTLTVNNSTISGNSANNGGGGFLNFGATVTVTNSTIARNTAPAGQGGGILSFSTFTAANSIVADNGVGLDCSGTISNSGGSIDKDSSCTGFTHSVTMVQGTGFAALASNGGPTQTHALLAGSAAIDTAPTCAGLTTDQRGVVRPQGSACDIGAYEVLVCTPAPSGMVSWWDGEGDANDIIGTNHGTLVNGAAFAAGKVGQAFSFDGVNDYVGIPHSASLNFGPTQPMSINLWVKRTNTSNYQIIFAKRPDCVTQVHYQLDWWETGNLLNFSSTSGLTNGVMTTADKLPLDTWTFISVTFDGVTATMYINGSPVASHAMSFDPNTVPLRLGGEPSCGGMHFGGLIDEVEIFDRALSAEEIAAIANAGSAGKCQATDTTPDPFTFTDLTGVPLSTVQTSNAITVSGIAAPAAISIVGGEYELNSSGTWSSSSPTTVANGDTVRVRHTSAATPSTAVDTTLTIGGVSDTFTSTTLGPDLAGVWNPVSQRCRRNRCILRGSVRVWNQGNATAPTSRLRVILSDDAVMGPGDTVLRESSIGRLRRGQSRTRPVNVPLPLGVNASGKYLFAVIDAPNAVAETIETNNELMYGPIP